MYLESYNKEAKTKLTSSLDFIIMGKPIKDYWSSSETNIEVFMVSLCDIGINVKGVLANFNSISEDKYVRVKFYNDIEKKYYIEDVRRISGGTSSKWHYKSCKSGKYTHGIIYNKRLIKQCVIDYDGDKKYKVLNRYVNDKLQIPMTEEILKIIDKEGDLFPKLKVWSKKSTKIKAYYISSTLESSIKELLAKIDLPLKKGNMTRWGNINTINDYVLEFNKEIKKSLYKKIKVRFNPETDLPDMRMFDYKMKPYKGQVALIEAGKRTLLDTEMAIYTCQMGTGKLKQIINVCNN